ncbi:DUF3426 domain-containing protein [Pseudomonas schmalbachii]|uniref:Zinc-ribbon domain-containing protein n=1 Tax=Pseudomonas schmalbachii TaxID=2816993 RepID=A0ABS3TTC3_9PSED|nr:DUF3426 domain-containing protein [Pseudomonas schmalbachii]MBO3276924.1 zinc-ribbon domain-containing protein [Pseudomonas schmalbachii]
MSDSFITQCPHCSTSFRVSQTQLGAANGAVRCGACLKVFNAPQHMLDASGNKSEPAPAAEPAVAAEAVEPPAAALPTGPSGSAAMLGSPLAPHSARHAVDTPQSAPATEQPAAPAKKGGDETLWIHDDLDLEGLNFDEELARLDEFELSQEFLSIEGAPKPADALLKQGDDKRAPYDERWAEELLEEEQDAPDSSRQEPSLGSLDSVGEEAEPDESEPEVESKSSIVADPAHEPEAAAVGPAEEDEDDLPRFSARRDDVDELDEPAAEDEPDEHPEVLVAPRTGPALRDESLRDLSDEPLHLDWEKPKKHWGRRILGLLLVLVALGGLAFQYIAYHFEELARQDQYRPWFAQVCPSLGCTLPSKVDVEQIRSSNLVVRSHPDFTGALIVDAIIYNRANFSQPFPLLELRFADLNGQLLASRRFKPSEYLSGELAGKAEMPPQTPIHISLDILDPGPKAVNYSLSFHSPE